jgi:predicted enzyme related to lactoylglutathione lyase
MPGARITHVEFPADDVERAKRFYSAVAGWEFQSMEGFPDYELFSTDERTGGAIGARGSSTGTSIRIFITVPDLERARDAAIANGGALVEDVTEVPGQGRYVLVTDPEGSEIALWQDPTG